MLTHGAGGPGEWIPLEIVGQGIWIPPWEFQSISFTFLPWRKLNFSSVWHGPLSRWLPFEPSSSKMGSLDIDPVYSTLCPSITSTRSTSRFCFNTFQYSIGGAVMLDTKTYGRDCMYSWFICESNNFNGSFWNMTSPHQSWDFASPIKAKNTGLSHILGKLPMNVVCATLEPMQGY